MLVWATSWREVVSLLYNGYSFVSFAGDMDEGHGGVSQFSKDGWYKVMDISEMQDCPHCGVPVGTPRREQETILYCSHCRLPQALVAGKYRITSALSEGGCGMLFLSRHIRLQMDPIRVIKFIKPDLCKDERVVKRLAREVEVTAALSQHNEHIVRVYDDFGEFPDLGHYFVMEYLQGEDLFALLQKQPLLPFAQVFHIFRQICAAIRDAHQAQVVHRDLKPHNIFLIRRREDPLFVKVIDFGIAKTLANESSTALTQGIIGTPEYMAPEQCSGKLVDHRADIYALGTMLYAMLVGYTPYLPPERRGTISFVEMAVAQMMEEPISPSRRREELRKSPSLDVWMSSALAKMPEARFSSVTEMLEALTAVEVELLGYPLGATPGMGQSMWGMVAEATSPSLETVVETSAEISAVPSEWSSHPLLATGIPVHTHDAQVAGMAIENIANPPIHGGVPMSPVYGKPSVKMQAPVYTPSSRDFGNDSWPVDVQHDVQHDTQGDREVERRSFWIWGMVGVVLLVGAWILWFPMFRNSPVVPEKTTNQLTDPMVNSVTTREPTKSIEVPIPVRRKPEAEVPARMETRPASVQKQGFPGGGGRDEPDDEDEPVIRRPSRPRTRMGRQPKRRRPIEQEPSRVVAPAVVNHPVTTSGCPTDGQTWMRFDLKPAQIKVVTKSPRKRYSSWICIQRGSGTKQQPVRFQLQGYDECFFELPSQRRRFRIELTRSQGLGDLAPESHYCLK